MRITRTIGAVVAGLAVSAMLVASAGADSIGPTTFEAPAYAVGNIDGQNGWTKTGGYDVAVAAVASFPDASGYGFGAQALRMSNAVVSGSFGDQTFSPGLASPAGEAPLQTHFEASFKIGTTQAAQQPGLNISVSPDNGSGARMSYLRFDDQADGVHVVFFDVTDPGPLGTVATFNSTDIATIDRAQAHTIRFSIDFKPGPANDVVKIYVDGLLKTTGTTWEDYYRYDPEQTGGGNALSPVSKLLYRASGTANAAATGKGFLIDDVSLASSGPVDRPTDKKQCKKGGWKAFENPSFKNQGSCVSYVSKRSHGKKNGHGTQSEQGKGGHDAGGHDEDGHDEHSGQGAKSGHSEQGEHGNQRSKHGESGKGK